MSIGGESYANPTLLERLHLLLGTSLFSGLAPEHLLDMAAETQVVTFSAGDCILSQDEPAEYVHIIIDGTVQSIVRSRKEGVVNEVITGWLASGDALGELLLMQSIVEGAAESASQRHAASFVALVTTDCLRLPREILLQALRRHWPLTEAFIRRLVSRVQHAESRLAELDCDPLTGLSSRHAAAQFYERHAALCRRAAHALAGRVDARPGSSVSVLVATIPGYLRLAEEHGRPQAEALLCAVAAALSASASRTTDLVARYGLAEFVAVLPQVEAGGASVVLERTRAVLRTLTEGAPPFALRLGIATSDLTDSEPLSVLVARAAQDQP